MAYKSPVSLIWKLKHTIDEKTVEKSPHTQLIILNKGNKTSGPLTATTGTIKPKPWEQRPSQNQSFYT